MSAEWDKAASLRELDITATDLATNVIQDILTRFDCGGGGDCSGDCGDCGDCGVGGDGGGDDQYQGSQKSLPPTSQPKQKLNHELGEIIFLLQSSWLDLAECRPT